MPSYNDPPTAAEQADWVDDDPSPAEISTSLPKTDREILKERVSQRGGRWSWELVWSGCLTTFGIGVTSFGRAVAKELEGQNG